MFLQSKNRNRFFINSVWACPQGQQRSHDVTNSADGQIYGAVSFGSAPDVNIAPMVRV